MKYILKDRKGITLIALVITIIVLLILAGVSLSLIAGNNGILKKATASKVVHETAQMQEEVDLALADLESEYYETSASGTFSDYVKAKLESDEGIKTSRGTLKVKENSEVIYTDGNGNEIAICEFNESTGKITITSVNGQTSNSGNEEKKKFTITYKANGGTGAPESQAEESGKIVTLSSEKPTKRTYNFVGWSTDINATTAEYNSGDEIKLEKDIELFAIWKEQTQAEKAQKPEEHTPTGFSHLTGTVEEGYVITDGINEFVWIPIANDEAYAKKAGTYNWSMTVSGGGSSNIAEMVQGDVLGISEILGINLLDASSSEYAVVQKAGGFWVGRYETGIESTEHENIAGINGTTSDSTNANNSNTYWDEQSANIKVASNMEPVRNITQAKALSIANNWKSGVSENETVAFQSGLITGSQWDSMCNFIGWSIANGNCSSWGNYANVAGKSYEGYHSADCNSNWVNDKITKGTSNNRFIFPTGKFVNSNNGTTAKKNIYDVAGNVWEWTTEVPKYNENNRVLHGGSVTGDGSNVLATRRHGDLSASFSAGWNVGFRMVLYVE